jgi:hypothetical protein
MGSIASVMRRTQWVERGAFRAYTSTAAMSNISTQRLETILNEAERRAVVAALRARPELTLEKLQDFFRGRYGATLRTITVRELLESESRVDVSDDGGPPIDRSALEEAKRLSGDAFDQRMLEVIRNAGARAVSASYLRARVGGPRWKLQASLRRLADLGQVERTGVTSSTRYRSTAIQRD